MEDHTLHLHLRGGFHAGNQRGSCLRSEEREKHTKKQRAIALGEDEVKQLLALMDTDKSGKISKQEFMSFMEAEFDRLDTDKSGELDVNELTKSQVRASRGAVGK
jgi:hypothetical protein